MSVRYSFCSPTVQTCVEKLGSVIGWERLVWHFTRTLVVILACSLFAWADPQSPPVRRILILNEVGTSFPLINLVDQGIRSVLQNSPYRLEFYREYFETVSFPDPTQQQAFRRFYLWKYQDRKPDLIITVGPSPLSFMLETHQEFFAGIPVVFCVPNRLSGASTLPPDFTGVEGDIAPRATVAAALVLEPGTKRLVVVGGTAPYDRQQLKLIKEDLQVYERGLDISYLTDLDVPSLLERLKRLPSNTIVLLGPLGKDAAGTSYNSSEIGPLIVGAANAPVFSMTDRHLGHGEVGGDLSSGLEEGKVVGGMALRILNGEKPQNLPRFTSATKYTFDWRALKRWGLKERNLPADSIVLNRPPSFWDTYWQLVLASICVLLAQSIAIFALLWQRARRRKTEAELRKSEEKFSKAFRRSPLAFTLVSLADYRFIEVNETFERYTGWRRDEVIGHTPIQLRIWVEMNQRSAFIRQVQEKGAVRSTELLFRRKDGEVWTGLVSSELINLNGEPCALSLIADITDRKLAEQALADVQRKLVAVQEEERTRIARDLHDDINQRIALVTVDIDQLRQKRPKSLSDLAIQLSDIRERLNEIAKCVQSISHELHSPQLEYLGLIPAMRSFCREFSSRQSVQIDFCPEDTLQTPSTEISLCLFRVLQEALHNAVKHSHVRRFTVTLTCSAGQLALTIADSGIGFDPKAAFSSGGLGLVSMRERVRLVSGTIVIDAKPMHGTTIHVRVPFSAADTSRQAILPSPEHLHRNASV